MNAFFVYFYIACSEFSDDHGDGADGHLRLSFQHDADDTFDFVAMPENSFEANRLRNNQRVWK